MIDHKRFRNLLKTLYSTVADLEEMFPGRHFTPDGHLVGSIGECLVADAYGLTLMAASNEGFDAVAADGTQVEIKATQSKNVSFRHEAQYVIVIKILKDGTFEEAYSGPGDLIWEQFKGKRLQKNGQFQIALTTLKRINEQIDEGNRIRPVHLN